jgi:hypothetical protein
VQGTSARLAYSSARSDVVKMQPKQFDGSAIEVIQQKTGSYCWIPCHQNLRDHLTATGIDQPYLLKAGTAAALITDHEGKAVAARVPYFHVLDGTNDAGELHSHSAAVAIPDTRKGGAHGCERRGRPVVPALLFAVSRSAAGAGIRYLFLLLIELMGRCEIDSPTLKLFIFF